MQNGFLRYRLNAGCYIGVILILLRKLPIVRRHLAEIRRVTTRRGEKMSFRISRRTEQGLEFSVECLFRRVVKAEVIQIQFKTAVAAEPNELANLVHVSGFSEGRHSHDL